MQAGAAPVRFVLWSLTKHSAGAPTSPHVMGSSYFANSTCNCSSSRHFRRFTLSSRTSPLLVSSITRTATHRCYEISQSKTSERNGQLLWQRVDERLD